MAARLMTGTPAWHCVARRCSAPAKASVVMVLLVLVAGVAPHLFGCGGGRSTTDHRDIRGVERGVGVGVPGGVYRSGAVSADHPLAARAGAEMLVRGGNAVDAAVATSFALSVVRPFSCGIGGGGFMVIHLQDHPGLGGAGPRQVAINYRELTPGRIGPEFYETLREGSSTRGALAVGVPGSVAGLLHALERYGTLDRATVLAPAIRLAREGFAVDEAYAKAAVEVIGRLRRDPVQRARFGFVWERMLGGGGVRVGDIIRLPEQGEALELIARDGVWAFYRGPIARAIVEAVAKDGGVLSAEDLAAYRVDEVEPLRTGFLGRTVVGMPLPSSGGVALGQILGMLERAGVGSERVRAEEVLTLMVEAFKHAFADRARWLGDPGDAHGHARRLLEPEYLDELSARLRVPRTGEAWMYGHGWRRGEDGMGVVEDGGTSHLSVVDARGNAVACTETINLEFGSLLAVPRYGFVLNNQMDDFTTRAGTANAFGLRQSELNRPGPGRRPLSSMSPTIVLDAQGRVEVVVGASGGPRIITGTGQVLLNVLVHGMGAEEGVAAPRVHHQWMPDVLRVDGRLSAERARLEAAGHRLEPLTSESAVQVVVRSRDGQGWEAAADPRKGGGTAGH